MKFKPLYKRLISGKITEYIIEIEGNKYRTTSGLTEGIKTTSEWTICKAKTYCTAEEQTIKEATAKYTKCLSSSYFENIGDVDNKTYFKPMLACNIEDYIDKLIYPCYSQPKLDGIRCIIKSDGMWSRNGNKFVSTPHIFEALIPVFTKQPDLILDGELYSHTFSDDFNAICSLVKKTKPDVMDLKKSSKNIEYHIYDLPSSSNTFSKRYDELSKIGFPDCCVVVETNVITNKLEIEKYFDNYIKNHYEGQMIRLDGKYENKRSVSLLKHKSFSDADYEIIGVEEGSGKLSGKVGKLLFEGFDSPVNGTHEYLSQLWTDKDKLIGKVATIKYANLTPDNKPRFPKVIAIRDYE